MKLYKHYSFDLWLTLIKSNPEFKIQRSRFFFQNFNYKSKTIEQVNDIFRKIDLMTNSINQKTGKNIETHEIYLIIISVINDYTIDFDKINLSEIYDKMENLFFLYLPSLYSNETKYTLDNLKQKGCTCNILSNTALIKSSSLIKLLENLKLDQYFEFQIYSDQVKLSKPNYEIFKLMHENAKKIQNYKLDFNDIIHVGDNFEADIKGGKEYGIDTFQINTNEYTIINLL